VSIIAEWISKVWKEVPVNIIPKSILKCFLSNVEDGMFFGMTVSKVARVQHLQKMKVQLKDHWTNFLIK
jgi:hypothetical protein